MKKSLFIIALGMIVFSSCKKEYTCECKTNGGSSPIVTQEKIKDSKKKATSTCEAKNAVTNAIITVCEIK